MRSWFKAAMGFSTAAACMGLASAQSDYTPTESSLSSYSNPSSTAANQSLTAPRTGIYGSVMRFNAASDNTIEDYVMRPVLINGQQFAAATGDVNGLGNAAFSFNGSGLDWFGSAQGAGAPSLVRVGAAKGGAWGAGLILSLAKVRSEVAGGDVSQTLEGDGIGLFGNLSLGGSDVYGQLGLFTDFDDQDPEPDNFVEAGGNEVDNTLFDLMVGWKKVASGEGSHAYNAELWVDYAKHDDEAVAANEASQTTLDIRFNHGYILKENPTYDVFLGSNSEIYVALGDFETAPTDRTHYGLFVTPNLAFQKTLMWGFEGFLGGGVRLGWEKWEGSPRQAPVIGGAAGATEAWDLFTAQAGAEVGLRWVKDNLAIEGSLAPAFLANGPHFIGGEAAGGLFGQVGVTLGI